MSAVTIDPSIEACQAIVARINATGSAYYRDLDAQYSEQLIDPLEEITGLRIDVCTEESETLEETIDLENRSSHQLRVWIRDKINDQSNNSIDPLKLLVRQLFQRLNNYDTSDKRVRVWNCDNDQKASPEKEVLQRAGLFVASLLLRVEVEAA